MLDVLVPIWIVWGVMPAVSRRSSNLLDYNPEYITYPVNLLSDTFDKILRLKKEYNVKTVFFFLIGDYSTFDTNVSASKTKYKLLIKEMVDYARVGLHPSYFTMKNVALLKKEKERLENITNMPVTSSRQHYLRFSLPETYQHLIDLEVEEDYSMGYASNVGFRASTCTPFYFYDLYNEKATDLKIYPFYVMDATLN